MDPELVMWLAKQRVRETEALAARNALTREARVPRTPLRVALGLALIRLGRFLVRDEPAWAGKPRG